MSDTAYERLARRLRQAYLSGPMVTLTPGAELRAPIGGIGTVSFSLEGARA